VHNGVRVLVSRCLSGTTIVKVERNPVPIHVVHVVLRRQSTQIEVVPSIACVRGIRSTVHQGKVFAVPIIVVHPRFRCKKTKVHENVLPVCLTSTTIIDTERWPIPVQGIYIVPCSQAAQTKVVASIPSVGSLSSTVYKGKIFT